MIRDFFQKITEKLGSYFPLEEEEVESQAVQINKVDFHNQAQRTRYVTDCLEQMSEASNELDMLKEEYTLVTSYLMDMEEIEALPDDKRGEIEEIARHLLHLEEETVKYNGKKNRMPDADYYIIRNQENDMEDGIRKIREAEAQAKLIKKDLKKLDGERGALIYRKSEQEKEINNSRGMIIIFASAYVVCLLMLAILQFGLKMNAYIGFFVATAAVAIAIAVMALRVIDGGKEITRANREMRRLISLQNTVRIRYVNNRQLLDYYYLKYHVDSGDRLEHMWRFYMQEKEERKQYAEASAEGEQYMKKLTSLLVSCRVKTPERWTGQVSALLDRREMVEQRHALLLRRQSLRAQIDYNEKIAEEAKGNISALAHKYPRYAQEILDATEAFESKL